MLVAVLAVLAGEAMADEDIESCRQIVKDADRLACYDRLVGGPHKPAADPIPAKSFDAAASESDRLSERMELEQKDKLGTFLFRPYRPVYVLPLRAISKVNETPTSPNPDNTVTEPLGYDDIESKFQLSFKTKVWQNIAGSPADLWFGYTQQSYWQVYNKSQSSPFRETDYEPEAFVTVPVDFGKPGFKLRYVNFGFTHQSNGRPDPLSRSWNRIYAAFGIESGNLVMQVRPWYRIRESAANDDNPDITDYVGRGELALVYRYGSQQFALIGRHSLKGGDANHGSLQFEWSFPLAGYLRAHVQAFTGYGESLIDYNHRQTTIGLGVSLAEWL
jgi:phospholipase A1